MTRVTRKALMAQLETLKAEIAEREAARKEGRLLLVRLSLVEREMAELTGMTPWEYARNKVALLPENTEWLEAYIAKKPWQRKKKRKGRKAASRKGTAK